MRNLISYFINIFDTPRISDENLKKFAEIHLALLIVNNPGGIYNALIAALTAAYNAYFGGITDEDTINAVKEGSKIAMNNIFIQFKDEASRQEGLIRAKFGKTSPQYQEFYPLGITEYTNSTLANVETLMTRIIAAGEKYKPVIGEEFNNLFTSIKDNFLFNRNTQLSLIGEVKGKKDVTIINRNTIEAQLTKNLLIIASNNVGNTEAMNTYFDQSFIRPKKHKTFSGEVGANSVKNIDERHYEAEDSIVLQNTGTTDLKFGLSVSGEAVGDIFVQLSAGDKKTVLASELGNPSAEHFLNVQNESQTINGEYKVTVEL